MGEYKWKKLGLNYDFKDVKVPTAEEVKNAKEILGII